MSRGHLATVLIIALMTSCTVPGQEPVPSRDDAARVVNQYLQALEDRDEDAILSLVAPRNEAREEVAQKLRAFGGQDADSLTTRYASDFPDFLRVSIISAEEGEVDKISLVAEDGRWYIALGAAPAAPGDRPPASTRSPDPS